MKGQIKMMETIGIMLVFFILLVLGMIFWGRIQQAELERMQIEFFEKRAIATALKAATLTELQCVGEGTNCIDSLSIYQLSAGEEHYVMLFGQAMLEVQDLITGTKIVLYNKTPEKWQRKTTISFPIILKNITKKHFGVLNVNLYT